MAVDYSLYLVTDSTKSILGDRDLLAVVRAALAGGGRILLCIFILLRLLTFCQGVTIVQYRDKTSETADLIRVGKQLHAITKEQNVPLLINDRVDVALAVGAEGVHVGQDDMDLATARKLLGPEAVIGVSCNSINEAQEAAAGGASYLGIGTMFATST